MLIKQAVVVSLGGALGALIRWRLSLLNAQGEFPLGTLSANLIGCFLLGVVLGLLRPGSMAFLFLAAGLCGALTTVSTFAHELVIAKTLGASAWYGLSRLVGGVVAVIAGMRLARLF